MNTIDKAQNGDKEAIAELLDKYEGVIINKCGNRFLRGSDFCDVVQEAKIAAITAIRTYRESEGASLATWIGYNIHWRLRRLIIDRNKSRVKGSENITIISLDEEHGDANNSRTLAESVDDGIDYQDKVIDKLEFDDVISFIDMELSELERKSVLLVGLGYKYSEIHEMLNTVSKRSVDNAVQRARKKLRKFKEVVV